MFQLSGWFGGVSEAWVVLGGSIDWVVWDVSMDWVVCSVSMDWVILLNSDTSHPDLDDRGAL